MRHPNDHQRRVVGLHPWGKEPPSRRERAHVRADGQPKTVYRSKAVAEFVADDMALRGTRPEPYVCPICRQWHLGRWRSPVRLRRPIPPEFYDELGDRAAGCLFAENVGSEKSRLKHLRRVGAAAAKRAKVAA